MYDYTGIIRDMVIPGCEDDVFVKPLEQLYGLGVVDRSMIGGTKIQKDLKTGRTSAAREFTRADDDPTGGSSAFVRPSWDKRYFEVPCEIHRLDLQEAEGKGEEGLIKLFTDAITDAYSDLKGELFDACIGQIRADLDATATYSDAALTRTAVTTPYNDAVDATVTVEDLDDAHFGIKFGKKKMQGYQWLFEPTVGREAQDLLAALNTWNAKNDGKPVHGGYAPIGTYKNAPVNEMDSMTVGDIFYFPKTALKFNEHMAPTGWERVHPGKFALKYIYRIGVNAHMEHVSLCAFLSNKD